MEEIVAKSCRNAFATVFLYAIFTFISKGGFILPYPIYEILFFVVNTFLYFKAFQLRVNLLFFKVLLIVSFVWMSFSIFFLQLIFPHEWLDSLVSYFPITDILIALLFILISIIKLKLFVNQYKPIYILFLFLLISKWGMFLFQ
jgi:hypothetical protein